MVPLPALTRGMTLGPGTGGAAASFTRGPFNFPGPGGATAQATMSGGINAAGAARALAAGLARGVVVGGAIGVAATAVGILWDHYRVKGDGTGGLVWDPGQNTTNEQVTLWTIIWNSTKYPSESAAAAAGCGYRGSQQGYSYVSHVMEGGQARCSGTYTGQCYSAGSPVACGVEAYGYSGNISQVQENAQVCPLVNGQRPTVGADGKCPTPDTSPREPITPDQAQQKLAANPPAQAPNYPALLADAIEDWGPLSMRPQDIHNSQLNVIASPNGYAGPVTTATDVLSGDTTTTATSYDFSGLTPTTMTFDPSRMSLTFTGSGAGFTGANSLGGSIPAARAEWAITTTTTKRDAQGNITSQTTTTTASPAGSASAPATTPTSTTCEAGSTILGCTPLGDSPSDVVPEISNTGPSWSMEDLGLPSACPASYSAGGHTISYAELCADLVTVRPLVIAGGALAALLIVLAGIREL